jgi:hypothetical protein
VVQRTDSSPPFSTLQGGVTSSSLEVLAGLALNDEEYSSLMMYQDGKPSAFCTFLARPPVVLNT